MNSDRLTQRQLARRNAHTHSGDAGKTHTWKGGGTVGDEKTGDQRDVWRRVSKME